jgi:hypothetical protein
MTDLWTPAWLIIGAIIACALMIALEGCAAPFSFYPPGQGPAYDPLIANAVRDDGGERQHDPTLDEAMRVLRSH